MKLNLKKRAHLSFEFAAEMGKNMELCDKVGINKVTFNNWREGVCKAPTNDIRIYKLARMIQFPLEQIFYIK